MFWLIVVIIACVIISMTAKQKGCLARGFLCLLLSGFAIYLFSLENFWLGGVILTFAILSTFFKFSYIDELFASIKERKKQKTQKRQKEQLVQKEEKQNTTSTPQTHTYNTYSPISYGRAHYSQFYQPVYVYHLDSISDYEINNIIEVKALRPCPTAITPSIGNFSLWNSSDREKLAYKKIREDFLEGKIYDLQQPSYLGYVEELCEDVFKALLRHEKDPRYVWWVMKRVCMMNPNVITKLHQIVGWYKDEYVVSETYKHVLLRKPELQDKSSWLETALLVYKLNAQDYILLKRVYGNRQKTLNECPLIKTLIVKIYLQTLHAAGDTTCTKISTFYKSNQHSHHYYIYTDIMHKCSQAIQNSVRSHVYNRIVTTQFKSEIDEQLATIFAPSVLEDIIKVYADAIFPLSPEIWEEFKIWIPALAKKTNISPKVVTPKRKLIQINKELVSSQEVDFHQVVDKLNDILADDEEPTPIVPVKEVKEDFSSQVDILSIFASHEFVLTKEQVNDIAKQQHTMPSVLIDNVNEQYFEQLDDVLIEENGENYIMNQEYYNSIK